MLRKAFKLITGFDLPVNSQPGKAPTHKQYHQRRNQLIQAEAAIGGKLFGPVPRGHEREFFCLDRYTWVWYESWHHPLHGAQQMMVQYETQPNGVLKTVNGAIAGYVEGKELDHLLQAIEQYYTRVSKEVYGHQLATA